MENNMRDWKNEPKIFIESMEAAVSREVFAIAFISGGIPFVSAIPPRQYKRFVLAMTHYLKEYEKTFGEIDSNWEPSVPTPFEFDRKGPPPGYKRTKIRPKKKSWKNQQLQ